MIITDILDLIKIILELLNRGRHLLDGDFFFEVKFEIRLFFN